MFVLGLDIGYSNLKLAMGQREGEVKTRVMPVGAGPLELMAQQLTGGTGASLQVMIEGERWVAGVEPERLQGWERELHSDYPSTKPYQALFYAALLLTEQQEIDVLVTGLPVSQYLEQTRREALATRLKGEHVITSATRLKGEHVITSKRSVTVKSVRVVPQPAGAYLDIVNTAQDEGLLELIQAGKTVVIDPGFFSVDWVALEEGEVRYHSSGTSLKAMSRLLQEVNQLIQSDHGGAPGIEKIEKAIRAGKSDLLLYGEKVAIKDYVERAAQKVAHNALTPLRKSMREEGMAADVVLLAGGGATAYHDAAKALFPKSRIVLPQDPLVANARGFWFCG